MKRLSTISAALAAILAAAPAHAGGFLAARFGGEQAHVTSDHVSAAYYNPAGLAMRGGTRFSVEGAFAYRTAGYDRPRDAIDNIVPTGETGSGTPSAIVDANSGEASLSNFIVSPFAAVASDLGVENLGVALAVSVPFGGQAVWDKNDAFEGNQMYPGAVDGTQRWTVIEGTVRALYGTAAVAYYIPQAKLSLGVGLNLVSQEVSVLRARTVSSTDDIVGSDGSLIEGRSLIDVTGTTFSLGAGLIFMPVPQLRLGLSYQSQPGFGKTTLTGTLTNKFGASDTAESDIDFEQTLPDVIRVGGSYAVNDALELRGQFEYQRWSVFDRQCVLDATDPNRNCAVDASGAQAANGSGILANLERNWEDSWSVRAGATYAFNPAMAVLGSVTYDTSAVPDETLDASFIDMPKVVIGLAGRFQLSDSFGILAQFTHVYYAERETDVVAPAAPPTRVPSTAGTYTQGIDLLQIAVEGRF